MLVAKVLGILYLWIDSLCIIQNDDADWNDQAPQMAKIYGNAYCTISADAAMNATDGFIDGCHLFRNIPKVIKYSFQGQEGTIYARERGVPYPQQPLHDYSTLEYPVDSDQFRTKDAITSAPCSALSSRGWVFQERMPSYKTLHFGHAETGWECRSLVDCECSPYRTSYGPVNTFQLSLKSMMDWFSWSSIIQHYTELKMKMNNLTDRLIALSDLAKARCEVTGDVYFTGLWASGIKGGLLWQVDDQKDGQQQPVRLVIAPTWSWTSVSARVRYSFGAMKHNNGNHERSCLDWKLEGFDMTGRGRPDVFAPSIQIRLRIQDLLLEVLSDDPQIEENKWSSTTFYRIRAARQV